MKRKIISVLLAFALMPLSAAWVQAQNIDDALIFEMDLSEYNDTDGVIKNAVTGLSDGIQIKGAANGTRPRLGSMESMTGETKYLSFSMLRGKSTFYHFGSVDLSKELCAPLANQDEMSVEFWVNYLATDSGTTASSRIFNFGPEENPSDSNNSCEIYVDSGTGQYFTRYARKEMAPAQYLEQRINASRYMNTWTHYVMTRKWNEAANEYTGEIFINGESQGQVSGGIKIDETDFCMQIGNLGGDSVLNGELGSFKIYNTALSAEDCAERYSESKIDFMSAGDTMNVIAPSEGKTLDTSPGEIEIIFDNYVDLGTIDNITFKNADTGEIPAGVNVYADEEITDTVYLKYGKLESDSEYILDIPDTVYSINQISCTAKQFKYRTEGIYIFYEDFEDYEVGGKPDGDKMLYTSSEVEGSLKDVTIKQAQGASAAKTKKYVSLVTNAEDGSSSNSMASVVFDEPITYDFVLEVGIRGQNGTAAARSVRMTGSAGDYVNVADLQNGTDMGTRQQPGGDMDKMDALFKDFRTSAKDEFGFIRMKFIFQKDTDGKYIVTGTCLDDENVDFRMPLIYTDCTKIMAAQQYNEPNADLCVDLSYVKIYKYTRPEIVGDNTGTLTQDSESINLTFSEDLDPSTVNSDCIQMVNANTGKTVLTKVLGYDEANRQITVKLGEYLDYGETYDLLITNIATTVGAPVREGEKLSFMFRDYDIKALDITVKNQDGAEITDLSGITSVTVEAKVKNTLSGSADVKVFAVWYDKDNIFKSSASQTVSIGAGSEQDISVNIQDIIPEEGDYLEVYVWEKTQMGYNAVMKQPFVISY